MTTINFNNGCGMYYDAYDVAYANIAIEGIYSDKDDIEFAEKLIGHIDRYWDEIWPKRCTTISHPARTPSSSPSTSAAPTTGTAL